MCYLKSTGLRFYFEGTPPHFPCLICLWLSWRSMSASTHHLYDPGFLPGSLLLGDDVLGQNYAAEQGADAGAGRRSDLHHGRPVHGGSAAPPQINRRPESPVLLCSRAPSYWCMHAAEDRLCCERTLTLRKFRFFGGGTNSKAENKRTLL